MKKYSKLSKTVTVQFDADCALRKEWDWTPSELTLEQRINSKTVYWSTSPSAMLSLGSSLNLKTDCRFDIQMEKPLNVIQGLGWFWHKSWVLPYISVDILCQKQVEEGGELNNIFINLYVIKLVKVGSSFLMTDIGVTGVSELKARFGKNIFTGLKFNSTSFNHSNSKFKILVLINNKQSRQSLSCAVIHSFLSPSIFVDSRRKVEKLTDQKSYLEFYSKFEPSCFDKVFYKKKAGTSLAITPNLKGFINYFTASNIRNKIKNPLFLIYRFHQDFNAYYNSVSAPDYQTLLKLLFEQAERNKLLEYYESENKSTHKPKLIFDRILPKTLICVYINSSNSEDIKEFKKIAEKFQIGGQHQIVSFLFTQQLISSKFKRISDLQILRHQYQKYCNNTKQELSLHPHPAVKEQQRRSPSVGDMGDMGDMGVMQDVGMSDSPYYCGVQQKELVSLKSDEIMMIPCINSINFYPPNRGMILGYYNMYL